MKRPYAIAFAVLLLVAVAWSLVLRHKTGFGVVDPHMNDIVLYRMIAARVAAGQAYEAAAVELHRTYGYPVRPFVTVRLPALALAIARFGVPALHALAVALLAVLAAVWAAMPGIAAKPLERAGAALAVLFGGATMLDSALVPIHELWAGALVSLALALNTRRWWPLAVIAAGLALAIRELALPFVLLALAFAVAERRRTEALAWATLVALFAILLSYHAAAMHRLVTPHDIVATRSTWITLEGPRVFLASLYDISMLAIVGQGAGYVAAVLALVGWFAVPGRHGLMALLYFVGMGLMFALFERSDHLYWTQMVLPAYFVGWAFLPRALRELVGAVRGGGGSR